MKNASGTLQASLISADKLVT